MFVSNLCSSADLTCKENTFFHSILDTYHSHFKQVSVFKGNESDRVYYKAFFDIDERVIDITNVILISSKQQFSVGKDYEKIKATGLDIVPYVNDLQSF